MQPAHLLTLLSMSASALAYTCTGGAVVFAVRGSEGGYNSDAPNPHGADLPQGMIDVANAIIKKAGGNSYLYSIDYPAADGNNQANLNDGIYGTSVQTGADYLHGNITGYVSQCSTGKVFALGYSQGATIVSGVLGGCPSGSFCNEQRLQVHGRVAGAAVFGDPGYFNGLGIDAGSAAGDGSNGRAGNNNGDQYNYLQSNFGNRFRSFCQSGDAVCNPNGNANGQDPGDIHGHEPSTYAQAAINFLTPLA